MSAKIPVDDLCTISDYLISDPLHGWDSMRSKKMISDVEGDWLHDLADWRVYVTLTFRDPRPGDVCLRYYRRLVQFLNHDAFGNHYVRKVGHSYFSYVLATEYQRRDAIHFHVLTDKPINFDLTHVYWNKVAGFAWIQPVKSKEDVTHYCSKYCVKGGEVDIYLAEKSRTPLIGSIPPMWWH